MGQLIIRDLDDTLLVQLKRKAWEQGLPLEKYMRRLLVTAMESEEARVDGQFPMSWSSPLHEETPIWATLLS
jgi:plasmid stability protein